MIYKEPLPNLPDKYSNDWVFEYYGFDIIKRKYRTSQGSLSGKGLKIAIIDSGYNPNDVELSGRILPEHYVDLGKRYPDMNKDYLNRTTVSDWIKELKNTSDEVSEYLPDRNGSHGSNMAKLIGGKKGICEKCTLAMINVYVDENGKNDSLVPLGICWAIANGYDLVNISQPTNSCFAFLHKAVAETYIDGPMLACAAGNARTEEGVNFPAAFQKTFAIGGFDSSLEPIGSQGRLIDFLTPSPYRTTSESCAIFTGILGLFLEKWKDETNCILGYSKLKPILLEYSVPITTSRDLGYGMLHPKPLFNIFRKHDDLAW